MDCDQIVDRLRDVLTDVDPSIVCAYVFGSVARGEAGERSDVDLAILQRERAAGRLTDLRFELEGQIERATGRPAQVVDLNAAPPDLVHHVLLDGRILLDRDPAARVRFEVRARNEYFDLLPVLQLYRRTGTAGS